VKVECTTVFLGYASLPRFFGVLASLMAHKYKEVYAAAAEVLGLSLAYMDSNLQVRETDYSKISSHLPVRVPVLATSSKLCC